jgi:hypothetical protein
VPGCFSAIVRVMSLSTYPLGSTMKSERPLKPTDSAIRAYYAELEAYGRQGVLHEGAVSSAFENLLRECARRRGWTLIPQLETSGERRNIPDGTVRGKNRLPRAFGRRHWENCPSGHNTL